MDEARTFGRLAELSGPTRDALRTALERTRAGAPEPEETGLYRAALVAAGMATGDREKDAKERWADPATLTTEQRAVAEILAEVETPLFLYRVPRSKRLRRQWLGLEKPGPIFTVPIAGRPAYPALRGVAPAAALSAIAALTASDAIPLLVEMLVEEELLGWNGAGMLAERSREIDASLGPWARETAEWMTRIYRPQGYPGAPPDVAFPVYLALARARIPIETRWEYFFPVVFERHPAEAGECLAALAPDRRDPVLLAGLRRLDPAGRRLAAALPILPVHPSPAIATFVRDHAQAAKKPLTPGAVKKTLEALGAAHPAVAAALGGKPAKIALTVASARASPDLVALDAVARSQLEAAQERYGGTKVSADALYADAEPTDDRIHPSLSEHIALRQDGRPAYDLWRTMGDSGALFVAGTSRIVGEIVHGTLECEDPSVQQAVTKALRAWSEAAAVSRSGKPVATRSAKAAAKRTKPVTRTDAAEKPRAKKR